MITPPSGLLDNMNSATRNPVARLSVSWSNILQSGEWFRLDQSTLDGNCFLTIAPYLYGITIAENINNIDDYSYSDESVYVKMLEGYSELIGDNYQYSISDFDCELENTNNRFTPRTNKNILKNPGFENSFDYWNMQKGVSGEVNIDEVKLIHGIRSAYLRNPAHEAVALFSDRIETSKDIAQTMANTYQYSQYLMGSGICYLDIEAFDSNNLSGDDLSTGLIKSAVQPFTLVSGGWNRVSMSMLVPSGTVYLRSSIALSGSWMNVDSGQLEQSLVVTDYDPTFIGDLILPKRVIKAECGFAGTYVPKFSGLTDDMHPKIKDDTITIHAYDWANKIQDTLVSDQLYIGLRSDELIANLCDIVGIDSTKRKLETGTHIVGYAWFPQASAWTYIQQVAEAEGGRVFFDEEGHLNFWNRTHISAQSSSSAYTFTFDQHVINMDYDINKSKIKNRIVVKASPKTLLDRTIIYNDTTKPQLGAGITQEFWAQFSHGTETNVPAINVEIPIVGVGITANSLADGTGIDLSSYVVLSSHSLFAESLKLNIQNTYNDSAYITNIVVYGQPVVTDYIIEAVQEDLESQKLYGIQELQIENNFIDLESYAENLAVQKLEELKEPRNFIQAEVVGAPHLQVGDIVTMQEGFDGQSDTYTINKNRWQFSEDFIQNLELEKKIILTWFVLDMSLLDSPDKLYT